MRDFSQTGMGGGRGCPLNIYANGIQLERRIGRDGGDDHPTFFGPSGITHSQRVDVRPFTNGNGKGRRLQLL
jgi:hypothetical protein